MTQKNHSLAGDIWQKAIAHSQPDGNDDCGDPASCANDRGPVPALCMLGKVVQIQF